MKRLNNKFILFFLFINAFVALAVWSGVSLFIPVFQLFPCILALLFTPGFIILKMVFSNYAKNIELFEAIPLCFGLSVSIWTIVAIFAYRYQMFSVLIINGAIMFDIIGLLALLVKQKVLREAATTLKKDAVDFEWTKFYKFVFAVVVIMCSILVAYKSQFQHLDFDTWYHLANIRKIIDNGIVVGGNPFFKLGEPSSFAYASHPWYLAFALTSKMAKVSVGWSYVILSAVLIVLFFFANYTLLKIILPDKRIALFAAIAMMSIWLYTFALGWRTLNSAFPEFIIYPHEFPRLVLFPLLFAYVFEYVRFYENELWLVISMLSIAIIGIYPLFVFWVPVFIVMPLLLSCFFCTPIERAKTIALAAHIILSAILILCLQISFPLTLPYSSVTISISRAAYIWNNITPLWLVNANLFSAHPSYLIDKGWQIILALFVIAAFYYYRRKSSLADILSKKNIDVRFIITLVAAAIGYYFILFNPFIVPFLLKLFVWPYPLYRMHEAVVVLSNCVIYGALASIIFAPILGLFKENVLGKLLPITILVVCSLSPLLSQNLKTIVGNALFNNTSPSMLRLPNEHPYAELSKLEKGVVAVDMLMAESVTALTHHYVVAVPRDSDISSTEQRAIDNSSILSYNVNFHEMKKLLSRYGCKYIVVPKDYIAVSKFDGNATLFDKVVDAGSDIIYEVKL